MIGKDQINGGWETGEYALEVVCAGDGGLTALVEDGDEQREARIDECGQGLQVSETVVEFMLTNDSGPLIIQITPDDDTRAAWGYALDGAQ